MKYLSLAIVALASGVPIQASAKEVVVQVDARSGPWANGANKKMRYGKGDELPPVTVPGLDDLAGAKVEIYAAEGAHTQVAGKDVGVEGIAGEAVDDQPGPGKKYYPSLYTPKILYPANRHALIAAFVDAQGHLLGRPFAVGEGVRVPVPDDAHAVALGFNDVSFKDNSGSLAVTVVIPEE